MSMKHGKRFAPIPPRSDACDELRSRGLLREGHLYQLVREHDAARERTWEIMFFEPGAEAYSFTFG